MDGVEVDEGTQLAFCGDEGGKSKLGASICDAWTQVQKWHKRAGYGSTSMQTSLGTEV